MTRPPDVPPVASADLADAIQTLRQSGLRLSTARRLVLAALFGKDGPVAAAQLARELDLDESSVYRNLELLEERGLVRHVHLGHTPGLYTLARAEDTEYLLCDRCGKVTAVNPDRLDPVREQIRTEFGYTARFTHFPIVGVCDECAGGRQRPHTLGATGSSP
jgi:Fur family transcriptional regulator, ferric uptake regulator